MNLNQPTAAATRKLLEEAKQLDNLLNQVNGEGEFKCPRKAA